MTLVYLAAAFAAGILLAAWLILPTLFWAILLVLPLAYLLLTRRDPHLARVNWLLLFLVLGGLRYQLALPSMAALALGDLNERGALTLIGVVAEEPEPSDRQTNLYVEVSRVRQAAGWRDASGWVLVQAPRDLDVRYGDEVQVEGELTTPPSGPDFSYREFLARRSVLSTIRPRWMVVMMRDRGNPLRAALLDFKGAALAAIKSLFPEPSAALLSGILLGHEEGIPRELRDAFNATNTGHIIAISGFNIAILAGLLGRMTRRLPGWLGRPLVILVILGYTLLVGASASVVRAALMGILLVVADQWNRQAWTVASLAAAALGMTLVNPYTLWDVGFQLSFLATLGIVLYTEPLTRRIEGVFAGLAGRPRARAAVRFLSDSLITTLAATLMTTPLVIAVFHRLSLIGLLTNLLILPVQPAVMVLSGLATLVQVAAAALSAAPLAGLLLGAGAQGLAAAGYVFTQYTILVVQWSARVPFGSFETPPLDAPLAAVIYLLLLVGTCWSPRALLRLLAGTPARLAGAAALLVVLGWTVLVSLPDSRTHLQFIATSGGQAVFVQSARGSRVLIDGSDEPSALLGHLGEETTLLNRRLDLVILTHLDEANLASLNTVVERYEVGQVLEPRPLGKSRGPSYEKWRTLLTEKRIPSTTAEEGVRVQVDEVEFEVLAPLAESESTNVALGILAGNRRVVLAHALSADDLEVAALSEADWTADTAVLPLTFDPTLLRRIDPATGIFFVGRATRAQPSEESLALLAGRTVLRTDERGDIELIVDGENLQLRTER